MVVAGHMGRRARWPPARAPGPPRGHWSSWQWEARPVPAARLRWRRLYEQGIAAAAGRGPATARYRTVTAPW